MESNAGSTWPILRRYEQLNNSIRRESLYHSAESGQEQFPLGAEEICGIGKLSTGPRKVSLQGTGSL